MAQKVAQDAFGPAEAVPWRGIEIADPGILRRLDQLRRLAIVEIDEIPTERRAAKAEAGAQDGGAPLPDGIELTTTPAAPPLTSAEAMEARLARLEEQQLRILSLLEAKLK